MRGSNNSCDDGAGRAPPRLRQRLLLAISFLLLSITPHAAQAQGLPVVGPNDTGSVQLGPAAIACDATMEGAIRYTDASNVVELCDDNVWTPVGSAIGSVTGADEPVSMALDDLSDVDTTGKSTNDVLTWDGSDWVAQAGSVGADSLDFDDFIDAMSLDASTSITADGTEVLSIINTGTGNSFLVEDQAADPTPFVIDAGGNVGIGNNAPDATLEVTGGFCVSDNAADVCSADAGKIRADNSITSGAFDIAENYGALEEVTAGTIVAADSRKTMYVRTATAQDDSILGVISTQPGFVLGWDNDPTFSDAPFVRPVALAGRVPLKVTGENGAIQIGDKLTLSKRVPGYGAKAKPWSRRTVAFALGSFTPTGAHDSGSVEVFVRVERGAWGGFCPGLLAGLAGAGGLGAAVMAGRRRGG
jgi:hypothetical protein